MKKTLLLFLVAVLAAFIRFNAEGALAVGVAEGGPEERLCLYAALCVTRSAHAAEKLAMDGCREQAK